MVDPGNGARPGCYAATDPVDVPTITCDARRRRALVVRSTGAVASRDPADGAESALAAFGDAFARRTGATPARGRRRRCGARGTATSSRSPPPTSLENRARPRRARPAASTWCRSTTAGAPASARGWSVADRFGSLPAVVDAVRASGRRVGIWLAPFLVGARHHAGPRAPRLAGRTGRPQLGPGPRRARPDPPRRARPARRRTCSGWSTWASTTSSSTSSTAAPCPVAGTTTSTAVAAYRAGLALVREVVGPDVYLVGCGAPLLPSVGLVDAMRVSPDTFHEGGEDGSTGLRGLMPLAARAWQQGRLWVNDPDCVVARPSYSQRERWADAAARASAGCASFSDRVAELDDWGLATVRDLLAAAGPPSRSPPDGPSRRPPRRAGGGPVTARAVGLLAAPHRAVRRAALPRRRTRRCAGGWSRWPSATPTGWPVATVEPPTQRTACLITYGDGIRRRGETPLHTLAGVPARPRRRPASATCTCCRSSRGPPTTGSPSSTTGRSTPPSAPGTTSRDLAGEHALMFDFVANHTSSQQPVVPGLAGRRPGVRRLLRRARPRLRRLPRGPTAHHPAVPRLPAAGRHAGVGLDDVRRGPGRRRRPPPARPCWSSPTCCSATSRAARPRCGSTRSASSGRSPAPPASTCPQTHAVIKLWRALVDHVAPGRAAADRDQRPARREHLLLRRRPRRGAPRLPVRAAAAGAALVRRRLDRPAQRLGRRASGRSATPRPGSTSWPATTASACGPPRASSTTTSATPWSSAPTSHGGEVSWASRPDGSRTVYELNLSYLDALCTVEEAARPGRPRRQGAGRAQHPVRLPRGAGRLLPLAGRLAARPRGHGDQPDQPPHQPRGARRRPARSSELRDDPRRRGVFDGHAPPARRTPAARGVLAVRHPAGRASRRPGLRRAPGRGHARRAALRHQRDRRAASRCPTWSASTCSPGARRPAGAAVRGATPGCGPSDPAGRRRARLVQGFRGQPAGGSSGTSWRAVRGPDRGRARRADRRWRRGHARRGRCVAAIGVGVGLHGRRRGAPVSRRTSPCRTAPRWSRPRAPSGWRCSTSSTRPSSPGRRRWDSGTTWRTRSPARPDTCSWGWAEAPVSTAAPGCCAPSVPTSARPPANPLWSFSGVWTRRRCRTCPGSSPCATSPTP